MRNKRMVHLITNTFAKEYRNKTLIFLLVVTFFLIFLINATMNFILQPLEKSNIQLMIPNLPGKKIMVFYIIISFWGGLLSNILGVNCVRSDFDHKVASQILCFPIKKGEYLLSRILGSWFLVIGYYIFSLLLALIFFSLSDGGVSWDWSILLSFLVSSLSFLTTLTWGVFFSLYFSKVLSFIATFLFGVFITISNSYFLVKDTEFLKNSSPGIFHYLGTFLHSLFPRVGNLDYIGRALLNGEAIKLNLYFEGPHFLLSYGLLIFLLIFTFRKKEHNY